MYAKSKQGDLQDESRPASPPAYAIYAGIFCGEIAQVLVCLADREMILHLAVSSALILAVL